MRPSIFVNPILAGDSYKASHYELYPPNTTSMYYHGMSRGGRYAQTMSAGMQMFTERIKGQQVFPSDIQEAEAFMAAHGEPFNKEGWTKLIDKHDGKYPIRIKSVPEGMVVPTHNVLFTVENTDPEFFWLPSYLETAILRAVWYPTTVATRSYYCKKVIHRYLKETSDDPLGELPFKLHDFGGRGVSSQESAGIGGCAHLFNFMGSDTMEGIVFANRYYNAEMSGFSIPACYDDQTEVFTSSGFKLFKDIDSSDKVLQYNSDGTTEFVYPQKIHEYDYEGDLVRFSTNGRTARVDIAVTPNHRMVRRSITTGEIEIKEASEFSFSQSNVLPQAGIKISGKMELTPIDKLRIAFQADGSFPSHPEDYTGKKNGAIPIRFTLKKERKKQRLREILNEIGWEYTESPAGGSRVGYSHFWIKVQDGVSFVKSLSWVNLEEVSHEWAKQFINECSVWDGSSNYDTIIYSSVQEDCAKKVQEVSLLAGYRSSISHYDDERETRRRIYTVSCCTSTSSRGGQRINKSSIPYKGRVYCVTVASGMILVKRNGVCAVSGNSEHSTVISWGRDREIDSYRKAVEKFAKPGKMFAVVSDSYDLMNVVENVWGGELREQVENSGATLVVRPDSGHPPDVVLKVVQSLAKSCGETTNMKGFRVLPKWLRVIQGDGNDSEDDIEAILANLKAHGFSASNVAFGMGGGLLQKLDRDTQRFAYKCSEAVVDGKTIDVFKDPVTDPGKRSKAGRLSLVHREGKFQTVQGEAKDDLLVPVFENGEVLKTYTLDEVRKRAGKEFV